MTRVLITGGGTAGHVLPGIAIASALQERGYAPADLHFVGSDRGVERRLVPEAGFPLTLLPGRGIQRKITVQSIRDNAGAIFGLLKAFGTAFQLLRTQKPDIVVSLGGYASVPCALWAVVLRVPIVVAEQNAVPGLANKLIGRFAKACGVSFKGVDLPRSVWTGNPVRDVILAVDRSAHRLGARAKLGLPDDRFVIAVFGGSLGALRINNAVLGAIEIWQARQDELDRQDENESHAGSGLAIRHVIGSRDFPELSQRNPSRPDDDLIYQQVEYENDMPALYAAADIVLCRSGATSVAELAVVGVPAILVPLPGAPGDHQTANARALVDAGAAVLVPDADLTAERLVREVEVLRDAPQQLAAMATSSGDVARPDAAQRLADLVEEHV